MSFESFTSKLCRLKNEKEKIFNLGIYIAICTHPPHTYTHTHIYTHTHTHTHKTISPGIKLICINCIFYNIFKVKIILLNTENDRVKISQYSCILIL